MAAPKVILQLYPVIPAEGETADEQFEFRKKNRPVGANNCLLYTSPSTRDISTARMPSSA